MKGKKQPSDKKPDPKKQSSKEESNLAEHDWGSLDPFAQSAQSETKPSKQGQKTQTQKGSKGIENKEDEQKKQDNQIKTDTDISKVTNFKKGAATENKRPGGERELQKFFDPKTSSSFKIDNPKELQPAHGAYKKMASGQTLMGMNLNEDDGSQFDQFAGKRSTYKEDLYTTKINYSKISREQKEIAERVEKEILHADSKGNVHLAEERHQASQIDTDETKRYSANDYDEEMRYSGVYRQGDQPKGSTFNRNQKAQQPQLQMKQEKSKGSKKQKDAAEAGAEKIKFIIPNKNKNVNVIDKLLKTFIERETKSQTSVETLINEWKTGTAHKELTQQIKQSIYNEQEQPKVQVPPQQTAPEVTTTGMNPGSTEFKPAFKKQPQPYTPAQQLQQPYYPQQQQYMPQNSQGNTLITPRSYQQPYPMMNGPQQPQNYYPPQNTSFNTTAAEFQKS